MSKIDKEGSGQTYDDQKYCDDLKSNYGVKIVAGICIFIALLAMYATAAVIAPLFTNC